MSKPQAVTTSDYAFNAVFELAEEGGYLVRFPAIPGLVTEGETLDEAREMAKDALRCFIEGHLEDGLPIPASDVDRSAPIREPIVLSLQTA